MNSVSLHTARKIFIYLLKGVNGFYCLERQSLCSGADSDASTVVWKIVVLSQFLTVWRLLKVIAQVQVPVVRYWYYLESCCSFLLGGNLTQLLHVLVNDDGTNTDTLIATSSQQ